MALQNKKEEDPKGTPGKEKKPSTPEQAVHFEKESLEVPERKKEISSDDARISAELRKEIEMMELDENTKKDAEAKAEKIEFLGEKDKIEHLLQMAREKGVVFAIQVARKMNEPYLLDILHDTLAREGFYLKMSQPADDDNDKKT
ncbi:MAG: hypothetical protein NT155_02550 [Candidatus Staskawiczbacteria bacterium]|nr:hypothetical protein [Candidatus Staskawiczbacteria bacterium]